MFGGFPFGAGYFGGQPSGTTVRPGPSGLVRFQLNAAGQPMHVPWLTPQLQPAFALERVVFLQTVASHIEPMAGYPMFARERLARPTFTDEHTSYED